MGFERQDDRGEQSGDGGHHSLGTTGLGLVSFSLASAMFAPHAAAQQPAEPSATALPPLEVTAKKAAKKKAAAKQAPPASSPAPQAYQAEPSQPSAPVDPDNAFTPSTGNSLQAGTGIGRLPGSVQDQPQVVNVVTQQQLQQQKVTTVEQALRAVPGVTLATGEGVSSFNGDQFRIRGLEAKGDVFVDGLRDVGGYVRDSFAIEEVQVIKGPSSETFGSGTTGGVINLRQKTAHLGDAASFEVSVGTDAFFRSIVDVNKQINSTTAVRAVGMYHGQDIPDRDHVESERWGFLGSFGFGLGTDTTWIVNYLHQTGDRTPDYGVPTIRGMGQDVGTPVTEIGLPRSTFYGRRTDHDKTDIDMITSRFQTRINDQLTFNNDTRLAFYQRDFAGSGVGCSTGCSNSFLAGGNPNVTTSGGYHPAYKREDWAFQNVTSVKAKFNTGVLRHEAVAGIDVFHQEDDHTGIAQFRTPAQVPIRTPELYYRNGADFSRSPLEDSSAEGTEIGLFASDRVWFTPEFSVLAGVRWTDFDYTFDLLDVRGGGAPINRESSGDFWSPKISVIWEPDNSQTYYASWATSAYPIGQQAVTSSYPIEDFQGGLVEEHESYEIGAKYSLLDGRLGVTGAVFQIDKDNAINPNGEDRFGRPVSVQSDEAHRIRGVEIGFAGQLTRAWTLFAGYAYLDSEVRKSTNLNNVGNKVAGVPEHSASLWTAYDLTTAGLINSPGIWTIGGGIFYQDEVFAPTHTSFGNGNDTLIPSSFTLDAMVSYELDGWRLAANGYNLTDELNYDASYAGRAVPSAGRAFVFTLGKQF
jgi:catecholate siderophore receptor